MVKNHGAKVAQGLHDQLSSYRRCLAPYRLALARHGHGSHFLGRFFRRSVVIPRRGAVVGATEDVPWKVEHSACAGKKELVLKNIGQNGNAWGKGRIKLGFLVQMCFRQVFRRFLPACVPFALPFHQTFRSPFAANMFSAAMGLLDCF